MNFVVLRRLVSAVLVLFLAPAAHALSVTLTEEFDGVEPAAAYATVDVTQNGDDLDFSITLGGLLGAGEDLQDLYFNLVGAFTGLALTSDNAPQNAYTLSLSPSVKGGAGSSFDVGVNFGNGAGPPGNGVLGLATFTLSADQALTPMDLLESSFTSGGIEAQFAIHIQGTNTSPGSETVGGVVPEPTLGGILMGAVLSGAVLRSRARSKRSGPRAPHI